MSTLDRGQLRTRLPAAEPGLVAEVLEALPARLRRKLDDGVDTSAWTVTEDSVTIGTATVRFAATTVSSMGDVTCDCLLAPKCLHLASILTICRTAAERPQDTSDPAMAEDEAPVPSVSGRLSAAQEAIVVEASEIATRLLYSGLERSDTLTYAAVLRLVHRCRASGLSGLGRRGATLARGLPQHAEPETRRNHRTSALLDFSITLHLVARAHSQGSVTSTLLGEARQPQRDIPSMKLQGVYCEPIISADGYNGCVTHLRSPDGSSWSVSRFIQNRESTTDGAGTTPGRSLARSSYAQAPDIGRISVPQQDLCRGGLQVSNATASASGRLGAGAKVQAVALPSMEWPDWWFGDTQRVYIPRDPAGLPSDRFLEARTAGIEEGQLVLTTREGTIVVHPLPAAETLGAIESFRLLGVHPGIHLRAVVRREAGRTYLLACEFRPDDVRLPDRCKQRFMPGLDRLDSSYFPSSSSKEPLTAQSIVGPPVPSTAEFPGIEILNAWLERTAVYGHNALPPRNPGLARDSSFLSRHGGYQSSQLLSELQLSSQSLLRDFDGTVLPDPAALHRAWLRLGIVVRALEE